MSVLNHFWFLQDQLSFRFLSIFLLFAGNFPQMCGDHSMPCVFLKERWSWSVLVSLLVGLFPPLLDLLMAACVWTRSGSPSGQRSPVWCRSGRCPRAWRQEGLCSAVSQSLAERLPFPSCILPVSACALLCFSHQGPQLGSWPFFGARSLLGTVCRERGGLRFPQRFWMWLRCPGVTNSCSLYLLMPGQRASSGLPWEERLYPLPWFLHPSGSNCFLPS